MPIQSRDDGRLKMPLPQPLLQGDDRQIATAWVAYLQSMAERLEDITMMSDRPSYANDAAAAADGVKIGRLYRTGNAVMVRLT